MWPSNPFGYSILSIASKIINPNTLLLGDSQMKLRYLSIFAAIMLCSVVALAQAISFSTFVPGASIAAQEGGNNATIAFTYAGNKFVGSVYLGTNNNQLYSTNLTGGNVQPFGTPVPGGAGGELVVGASLGQAGFAAGDIYVGSSNNGQIYHYANSGGSGTLFATVPSGAVRQIFFDPGSSFGGNMLVATTTGNIYKITSTGTVSPVASVGEDTEGMDIATSAWGPFAGDLLVSSEGSGSIRLVSPTGIITTVLSVGSFPSAETVSFVPLNLDPTSTLQGLYVANYPIDIQFAAASQFAGLLGDAIVTSESGGSTAWDVHYNSGTGTFTKTLFTFTGNSINQFEDGIFVTPTRISETNVREDSPFQVRYASNLPIGDSVVNVTNTGANSTVSSPNQNGNLCVNVYTFSPDEQLISCCSCLVTPNALISLSARNDLISNTLTPGVPTSIVIKLLASAGTTAASCNASTVGTGTNLPVTGMAAFGTTIHALPVTSGTPATTYGETETRFSTATLSAAELTRISNLCGFIQTNGSGFGICKSCRFGGLGAVEQ